MLGMQRSGFKTAEFFKGWLLACNIAGLLARQFA
jgi:hypothetical protein